MHVYQKFIIETIIEEDTSYDYMIVAKCTYHKQLVAVKENVKGGGTWVLDRENKVFTLMGDSHDFGEFSVEDVKKCVENYKVFRNSALMGNLVADGYKFKVIKNGEIVYES